MVSVSKSGIGSSTLLCPVSSSTTTITTTLSVPRVLAEMNQGFPSDGSFLCVLMIYSLKKICFAVSNFKALKS